MKNLAVRTLTGAVYVLLLIGCTVWSPVASFLFFSLLTVAVLSEFAVLVNSRTEARINIPINSLAGFLLVSAVWLSCVGSPDAHKCFALYGALLLYIMVSELYRNAKSPLQDWALAFASQIYIAVPFSMLPLLCIMVDESSGSMQYQWVYVLALFVFLWTNDTGAYLVGCGLSRYFPAKLFPRISPKKSWVGSVGGCLLTLLASVVVCRCFPGSLSMGKWIGYAMVVVVFGTWGDLVESLLKRQLGVKDSGNILPGHGGLLDRLDSALLAIPAVVLYNVAF